MYPKVLILFETFHLNSGGGITLSNLFKDWDISCIANSTMYHELNNCSDNTICSNYYALGNTEIKTNYIFRKFLQFGDSGVIKQEKTFTAKQQKGIVTSYMPLKIKKYLKYIFEFFGLNDSLYTLTLSDEFLNWVNTFNPDIIYAQPSSKSTCLFIEELRSKTGIPIVLHIMDDWISVKQNGFLNKIRNENISIIFERLLKSSNALFSISEGMRKTYKEQFGKESVVFHNTLDIEKWIYHTKKTFEIGEIVKILYAGRIGIGTFHSLLEFIQAAQELEEGIKLEIHIQAPYINEKYSKTLTSFSIVKLNKRVEYSILPQIFSGYDILLLPIDFENKGMRYLKYSMPTKVPEFMISGTPIILYAPNDIYLHEDAIVNKWAYIINVNTKNAIKERLKELINDSELRKYLSETAYTYALDHYDGKKIREKFKMAMTKIITNNSIK